MKYFSTRYFVQSNGSCDEENKYLHKRIVKHRTPVCVLVLFKELDSYIIYYETKYFILDAFKILTHHILKYAKKTIHYKNYKPSGLSTILGDIPLAPGQGLY